MTPAVDQWPAAARRVAVAAAGHSDPLLLHHLKGHDPRERCWRYDWVLDLDLKGFLEGTA